MCAGPDAAEGTERDVARASARWPWAVEPGNAVAVEGTGEPGSQGSGTSRLRTALGAAAAAARRKAAYSGGHACLILLCDPNV